MVPIFVTVYTDIIVAYMCNGDCVIYCLNLCRVVQSKITLHSKCGRINIFML